MSKILASILITSYNKSFFLKKTIKSCISQDFKNKEILVFDDCSTDNSLKILSRFKKIKVIKNRRKKFDSSPLNQINGIVALYKKSKGKIIFLLDGDDQFKKDKISLVYDMFEKDKNLKFIQDRPFLSEKRKYMTLKKKNHLFSIWPSFYPTSCMSMRKEFFKKFLKHLERNKFPNLEIDARLSMFAFLQKEFIKTKKKLTIYNFDEFGITSNYTKFNFNWWKKRNEAFEYMRIMMKKMRIKFKPSYDFYITRLINMLILNKN